MRKIFSTVILRNYCFTKKLILYSLSDPEPFKNPLTERETYPLSFRLELIHNKTNINQTQYAKDIGL